MTKSFMIALAGFAVGLGVTTALTFISPVLEVPVRMAKAPDALLPGVEQRIALTPFPGDGKQYDKSDALPTPAPDAQPDASPQREVPAQTALPKSPPPPPPVAPMVKAAPAASTGPKMPAVKQTGIDAAALAKLEPEPEQGREQEAKPKSVAVQAAVTPPALRPPNAQPQNPHPSDAVIAAEARRREQMEHENVRLSNVTEPAILPPAPPPLPPAETEPDSASASSSAAVPGIGPDTGPDSGPDTGSDTGAGASGPPARINPRETWRRFAALAPPIEGRAQVAIVLDDMGLSQFRSDRAISLPRPITLAILPYGNHLDGLVARARTAGHEILLHLPMEPNSEDADPGPNALLTGLPLAELDRRIATNLLRLDGYVGVNNHMGSRFTASEREMRRVMRALRARGLLFLDSLTTGKSTGFRLAREYGIPTMVRDIFLDNDRDPAKIRQQLALTAATAREHGHAIAIGHPYPETLDALEGWLPGLRARGLILVPISALLKQRDVVQSSRKAG
jgi:uncharacterized protein